MWPETLGIRTYSIVYGLSILAHVLIALGYCWRRKIPLRVGGLLGFAYAFGMIVGAKILYDLLEKHFAGLDYFRVQYYLEGGLWGGPLAYLAIAVAGVFLLSRDRRTWLDLVVLTLPIPMILAKVACFCNGCCYGAESSLPWAIAFPEGAKAPAGVARHPTQLYEILVLLTILIVLGALDRQRWRGTLLLWFVAIYGVGRPLTELFRGDAGTTRSQGLPTVGPFTASQITCLAAATVAVVGLLVFSRRVPSEPAQSPHPTKR
jgi:phosphatidylglycerol:prolipoprotein diacylglycerol transferase